MRPGSLADPYLTKGVPGPNNTEFDGRTITKIPCNVVGCQRFDPEIGPTQMGGLGTSRPLLARKES